MSQKGSCSRNTEYEYTFDHRLLSDRLFKPIQLATDIREVLSSKRGAARLYVISRDIVERKPRYIEFISLSKKIISNYAPGAKTTLDAGSICGASVLTDASGATATGWWDGCAAAADSAGLNPSIEDILVSGY